MTVLTHISFFGRYNRFPRQAREFQSHTIALNSNLGNHAVALDSNLGNHAVALECYEGINTPVQSSDVCITRGNHAVIGIVFEQLLELPLMKIRTRELGILKSSFSERAHSGIAHDYWPAVDLKRDGWITWMWCGDREGIVPKHDRSAAAGSRAGRPAAEGGKGKPFVPQEKSGAF
jgi:hypothetical protein